MSISHNKSYEREFVHLMAARGLDCHRVAGSGAAATAVCDCILFYEKKSYLVEVKATKEEKFYMRGKVRVQLEKMMAVCEKNGVIPLLAIKFKHRGWNLHIIHNFDHIEFNSEVNLHANSGSCLRITEKART